MYLRNVPRCPGVRTRHRSFVAVDLLAIVAQLQTFRASRSRPIPLSTLWLWRSPVRSGVLWDDLSVRDPMARLWPQTERLKAALLFDDEAEAIAAANGLFRYLEVSVRGLWRDKLNPDGSWVEEPAPASSFYHVMGAVLPLLARGSDPARD